MSGIVTVTNNAGVSFYKQHPFYEGGGERRLKITRETRKVSPLAMRNLVIGRKRALLISRLKTPTCLLPFRQPITKPEATQLFKMLLKYRPYSKVERQQLLLEEARCRAAGKAPKIVNKNEFACVTGFNAVTSAIEKKTAKLVVIADDVNPIELVAWMPTLCKKMEVPYVIVKGKSRLGTLTHQKRASCIAVKKFRKEDANTFKQFICAVAHKA